MAEVVISLPDGNSRTIGLETGDTSQAVVDRLLSHLPAEEKPRHKLLELKKGGDGILFERVLPLHTDMNELKKGYDEDKTHVVKLALLRLPHAVKINFNMYFRMTAGVGLTSLQIWVSEWTTVSEVCTEVLTRVKKTDPEGKYYLFGNYASGKDLRILQSNEKIHGLKTAYETPDENFFQYQIKPDKTDNRHMGVDKQGWLEVKETITPVWKKRWFTLRGSSLFFYKSQTDSVVLGELANVGKCGIKEIGSSKKGFAIGQKFSFKFELTLDAKTYLVAAEDEQSMKTWIHALKNCKQDSVAAESIVAGPERTFIPIGAATAPDEQGRVRTIEEAVVAKELSLINLLEVVRDKGDSLLLAPNSEIIADTKALIASVQELVVKISKLSVDVEGQSKKDRIAEASADAKAALKHIIPAAKAVAMQPDTTSIETTEKKDLKKKIDSCYQNCEHLYLAYHTDTVEEIAETPMEEIEIKATGVAELDSAIGNLNMFGMTPELQALMSQAENMSPEESEALGDIPAADVVDVSKLEAESGDLDAVLAGLQGDLADLDVDATVPELKKPAAGDWKVESAAEDEMCGSCFGLIIGPTATGLGKKWHPDCYYCSSCMCPLADLPESEVFEGRDGNAYCKKDYVLTCPPCMSCSKNVVPEDQMPDIPSVFHKQCFVCHVCRGTLAKGPVYSMNNLPACATCFHADQGTLCVECQKPIFESAITVFDQKRHPECFICSFCKSPVTKETAKGKDNQVYCEPCFLRLF